MFNRIYIIFLCLILCFNLRQCDEFKATKQWKKIEEGQSVPAGLHYRINLETGYKEAKLLDDESVNDDVDKHDLAIPYEEQIKRMSEESTNRNDPELSDIERMLQNLPDPNARIMSEEELQRIKSQYKTYDQIKSEMNVIKMDIKTDNEIIVKLLHEYLEAKGNQEKIEIMKEFESLVHQIDNALVFLSSGGYDKIIVPNLLNQTNTELRRNALLVLGAALQNNPKAKIYVFEKNAAEHLTKCMVTSTLTVQELTAALYAFGGLLRGFPAIHSDILPKTGIITLLGFLTSERNDIFRPQIQIIRILDDIFEFYTDISAENRVVVLSHFSMARYKEALSSSNYCVAILKFIENHKSDIARDLGVSLDLVKHLDHTKELCIEKWSQDALLRHLLLILRHKYGDTRDPDDAEITDELLVHVDTLYEYFDFLEFSAFHQYIKDEF